MRGQRRFFSMKTIRNRIIAVQLAVIIPAIILLGVIIYSLTTSLLIKTNSESYYKVLETSDVILTQHLGVYRDIARNILMDNALQSEIRRSCGETSESVLMNQLSFIHLNNSLEKYVTGFSGVRAIYVYDRNGKLFYLDYGQQKDTLEKASDYEAISQTSWFQRAEEEDGYEIFVSYNAIDGAEEEFSCIKVIKDLETMETLGMMILNFDKEAFGDIFPYYEGETGIYTIVDRSDDSCHFVVLDSREPVTGEEFEEILGDRTYFAASYQDEATQWELFYVIKHDEILGEADAIKQIIGLVLMVTIAVLLGLTVLICNRITKPLYQLRQDIARVGEGERYLKNTFPDDEIGQIGQEFQKMVNEKLALSERITQTELKTKEAELELLQSNINPHFLYNTLDSLYWMAILEEADDIAEMTKALANVFRIALSQGEKKITIKKELEFIESYLYIQNIRFDGKISADICADERLMNIEIPKLLLQPFVENAIYHGLEPKMGDGHILLRVYQDEERIYFEICDNGVGMDVEKALQKGYALRNSMERIRLIYGGEGEIEFQSQPGKGVCVKISIPKGDPIC